MPPEPTIPHRLCKRRSLCSRGGVLESPCGARCASAQLGHDEPTSQVFDAWGCSPTAVQCTAKRIRWCAGSATPAHCTCDPVHATRAWLVMQARVLGMGAHRREGAWRRQPQAEPVGPASSACRNAAALEAPAKPAASREQRTYGASTAIYGILQRHVILLVGVKRFGAPTERVCPTTEAVVVISGHRLSHNLTIHRILPEAQKRQRTRWLVGADQAQHTWHAPSSLRGRL